MTEKYIQQSAGFTTLADLANYTYQFLTDNFASAELTLLCHQPAESPLKIIKSTHAQRSLASYRAQLKDKTHVGQVFISHQEIFEPVYIFIFETSLSSDLLDVIGNWRRASLQLCNGYRAGFEKANMYMGNLIAQLLHDIHSLMELVNNPDDAKTFDRQSYQTDVNKNLLFFIRDLELFKTEFELMQFFKDSLSDIGVLPGTIEISASRPALTIKADMELLSKAMNELIKNALQATDNMPDKIHIDVSTVNLQSPFISDPWLQIAIRDEGKGISSDFLPYVKKPFFTTDKYIGHSGFGLAIAEKIIHAHHGFLKIDSEVRKYTQVNIYLRGIINAKEE